MGLYVGNKFVIDNGSIIYKSSSTSGIGTTENIKITASDGAANDEFGYSVAVGCGRIVVGAYRNDIGSNSDQGSAYIYDLNGNEVGIITASDGAANDEFGYSVAVGSGRIVVGASRNDDNGSNSGSAYIFDLDGNQLAKITASDAAASDFFGNSVAVGSGRIVVGAYGAGIGGAAYIYDLDGTNEIKITAPDGANYDYFGMAVAVGCGRIVVGAHGDDDDGDQSGSAYIFDLDGNQLAKITASDAAVSDNFGYSVAVGYGKIIVGTGAGFGLGSAYIFDLNGNQVGILTASDGALNDSFGHSVAVGSDRIVVGAYRNDIGSNADQGSAYIYDLDGNEVGIITASDGAASDYFGRSVAVGSGRIVVGAYGADNGSFSGSAYMWEIDKPLSDYYDDIVDNYRY